jgi:lipopolysaccharide export system permease protein
MKRLDRLVLAEIIGPYFGSIALFTGLFMGADNLIKIIEYAGNGVSQLVLFQFFLLALPPVLALTSPMGMLLATLLGFGRLSGDSEITALSAAGVPMTRIMRPVAVFAFAVTCIGIYVNDTVVPLSQRGRQAIIKEQKSKAGNSYGTGAFMYRRADDKGRIGLLIEAEGSPQTIGGGKYRLRDVTAVFYTDNKPTRTVYAATAEGDFDSKDWSLYGYQAYSVENGFAVYHSAKTNEVREETLVSPEELATSVRPNDELTTAELRKKARILQRNGASADARDVEVEIARRILIPFGSLIFALVGAPLGITPNRASKGVGFGYSVLITTIYWILLQVASILGHNGTLPPVLAVSIPNIIGAALGIYLIWRAQR